MDRVLSRSGLCETPVVVAQTIQVLPKRGSVGDVGGVDAPRLDVDASLISGSMTNLELVGSMNRAGHPAIFSQICSSNMLERANCLSNFNPCLPTQKPTGSPHNRSANCMNDSNAPSCGRAPWALFQAAPMKCA